MAAVILSGLNSAGDPIKIAVDEQGQLVTVAGTSAISLELLDKLNTLVTKLDLVATKLDEVKTAVEAT